MVLRNLKNFILSTKINLKNIEIRNHPSCFKSNKHLKLIREIKKIISTQSSKKYLKKNFNFYWCNRFSYRGFRKKY